MQPERDKQRLFHHVPVGQPPFIMPHSSWLCFCGGETLIAMEGGQSWPQPPFRRPSRLKAVPKGDPRAELPAPQFVAESVVLRSPRSIRCRQWLG
jgi:hypothetical protein